MSATVASAARLAAHLRRMLPRSAAQRIVGAQTDAAAMEALLDSPFAEGAAQREDVEDLAEDLLFSAAEKLRENPRLPQVAAVLAFFPLDTANAVSAAAAVAKQLPEKHLWEGLSPAAAVPPEQIVAALHSGTPNAASPAQSALTRAALAALAAHADADTNPLLPEMVATKAILQYIAAHIQQLGDADLRAIFADLLVEMNLRNLVRGGEKSDFFAFSECGLLEISADQAQQGTKGGPFAALLASGQETKKNDQSLAEWETEVSLAVLYRLQTRAMSRPLGSAGVVCAVHRLRRSAEVARALLAAKARGESAEVLNALVARFSAVFPTQ